MRRRVAIALWVVALAPLAVAVAPAHATPRFERAWGHPGGGADGFGFALEEPNARRVFKSPSGLAVDGPGNLWVADALNNRIVRYSPTGRNLGTISRNRGVAGLNPVARNVLPGRVFRPEGIALAPGRLIVAGNGNDRIESFTRSGRLLTIFAVRRPYSLFYGLSRGSDFGQVHNPFGIARAANGNVYVADLNNARVDVFSASGTPLRQIGGWGTGGGRFLAPFGIAIGPDGTVYVSDRELNRIQRFTPTGRLLQIIGATGSQAGQFYSPQGLAFDRKGRLLVADSKNNRIDRFSGAGAYIDSFGEGHLSSANYVATGSHCEVYVSDYRRIVKFVDPAGCSG